MGPTTFAPAGPTNVDIAKCSTCPWQQLCEAGSPGHTHAEYGTVNRRDLFCESRIEWFETYVDTQVARVFDLREETVTP